MLPGASVYAPGSIGVCLVGGLGGVGVPVAVGLLVVNVCFRLAVKRVFHRVWCFLVSWFRLLCKCFGGVFRVLCLVYGACLVCVWSTGALFGLWG